MKINFIYSAFLVAGLFFAGSTGNLIYGQAPQNQSPKKQSVKYTCSMHPEVVKDMPGKCPKCGIQLVGQKDKTEKAMQHSKDSTTMKQGHMKMKQDSTMKHDHMKMKHDSTMQHDNMRMKHDSASMKPMKMKRDSSSMKPLK